MVYDINGTVIGDTSDIQTSYVSITEVKTAHPSYNDDELLDAAITLAKAKGITTKIVWDGTDIRFSGTVEHILNGFAGIDFNNSKIIMPNHDNGTILHIVPDASEDINVDASEIYKEYTTDSRLYGKVFALNDNESGNADMCLGDRTGSIFSSTIYCSPVIMSTITGHYMTGDLFLVPESGDVSCYNVHDYPVITFEITNATIVTYDGAVMTRLLLCGRSNTHIHNIKLLGRSGITSYHAGVISIKQCCGVEIDHISGTNPVQQSLTSGYAIGLFAVSFAYLHDCYIGDELSWGAVGCNHLTNTIFERCHLNRWDCHYAQYGFNTVRDCVLNKIQYGLGNGTLLVENCTIIEARTSESIVAPIELRSDCPAAYDGNITIKGCSFYSVSQPANKIIIWQDACYYAVPENSKVTGSPKKRRIIENCKLIDGCKSIFKAGSRVTVDQPRYNEMEYIIKDTTFNCSDTIIDAYDNAQAIGAIIIEGCRSTAQSYITNLISSAMVKCINSNFENKTIRVRKNTSEVSVVQCRINSIVSDETSSYLMMLGCRLYGTQSFSNFNNYSAYGNVAGSKANTPAINVNVS